MIKVNIMYIMSLMLIVLGISLVISVPVGQFNLIGNQTIYNATQFEPLVFLNQQGGRLLFDDPYGIWSSGNISNRVNNYAFTGEQIEWKVLVWDKNGVPEKISDVFAGWTNQTNGPIDPEKQVNCQFGTQLQNGANLSANGYLQVRRPGDQNGQQTFNSETMGIYVCRLTIEPSCVGQKWMGVKVVDLNNLSSTMTEAESWYCNPSMSIDVSGSGSMGNLGPGEIGSTTFSITNNADTGSGMEVVFYISGTDFYDPSSSGGLCPTTNKLELKQFSYSATQGSKQVLNQQIPYGILVDQASPILGTPVTMTSPGSDISLTLKLEIPEPCNGQFTDGDIFLWAVAV